MGCAARTALALAGCAAGAAPALAEGLLPARTDVAGSRAQPDYDPAPILLEPFTLTLALRDQLAYDSNVFGVSDGAVGDGIGVINPSARVHADLGRLAFDLSGDLRLTRFFKLTSQNFTEYAVNARGAMDLGDWSVVATADLLQTAERHGDAGTPLAPITPSIYRTAGAELTVGRRLGAINVKLATAYQQLRYNDLRTARGQLVSQRFRDSDQLTMRGEADYLPNGIARIGAYVDYTHATFDEPLDRTNSSVSVGGLFAADFGMARIETRVAYLQRNYGDAAFEDFSGLVFQADGNWYPTQLLTVGLHANRGLNNSGVEAVGSILTTAGTVTLDWEALRNLLVHAEASKRHEDFTEIDAVGNSDSYTLSAEWRLNRSVSIGAYGKQLCRRSTVPRSVRDYCAAVASLSVTLTP